MPAFLEGAGDGEWVGRDGLLVEFKESKHSKLKQQQVGASGSGKLGSQTFKLHPYKCFLFFFLCTLQSKSQGSVFVRIHAPWQVLAREAEFLKIKVPTKKVRACFSCGCGPPEGRTAVNNLGTSPGGTWVLWSWNHTGLPSKGQWCEWDRRERVWGGERGWVWETLSPRSSTWDVLHGKPNLDLIKLLYSPLYLISPSSWGPNTVPTPPGISL